MASKKTPAVSKKTAAKKTSAKKPAATKKKVVVKTGARKIRTAGTDLKTINHPPLFGDVRTETTLVPHDSAKHLKKSLQEAAQRYASGDGASDGVRKMAEYASLLIDGHDPIQAQQKVWAGLPSELTSIELTRRHVDMSVPTDETPEQVGLAPVDVTPNPVLTLKASDESPENAAEVAAALSVPEEMEAKAEIKAKLTDDGFLAVITRRGSTKKIVLDFARNQNDMGDEFKNRVTDPLAIEREVAEFLGLDRTLFGHRSMAGLFFSKAVGPLMNAIVQLSVLEVVDKSLVAIADGVEPTGEDVKAIYGVLTDSVQTQEQATDENTELRNVLRGLGKSEEEIQRIIEERKEDQRAELAARQLESEVVSLQQDLQNVIEPEAELDVASEEVAPAVVDTEAPIAEEDVATTTVVDTEAPVVTVELSPVVDTQE